MTAGFQGRIIEEMEETTQPEKKMFYVFVEYVADVEMHYKGHHIRGFSTMNDYYGEFTCIKNAIEEALEHAKEYGIDKDSEASIQVLLRKEHLKKQKTGKKQYFHPEEDEYEQVEWRSQLHKEERTIWTTRDPLPWEAVLAKVREEEGV